MSACAAAAALPVRYAARVLVADAAGRILLFRFTPDDRAPYWATPGGQLDPGETFEAAAARELFEETGVVAGRLTEIARRTGPFRTFDGVDRLAVERYFLARVAEGTPVDYSGHTEGEREWMRSHRWWDAAALAAGAEPCYPPELPQMLEKALAGQRIGDPAGEGDVHAA